MALDYCELFTLNVKDLFKMKLEFPSIFKELIVDAKN
jgi:hypothetical protein